MYFRKFRKLGKREKRVSTAILVLLQLLDLCTDRSVTVKSRLCIRLFVLKDSAQEPFAET